MASKSSSKRSSSKRSGRKKSGSKRSGSKKSGSKRSGSKRSNSGRNSRGVMSYREFISKKLKSLRRSNPNLDNTEYMRLAAEMWNEYKATHGITQLVCTTNTRSKPRSKRSSRGK